MSTLPMTLSLVASFMSAITLLGVPAEVYTAGTQFAVSVLVYPLVMAIVIHFYLPVYDQLRLTTSYQYLQLRNQDTSTFCALSSDYSYCLWAPSVSLVSLQIFVQIYCQLLPACNLSKVQVKQKRQ